MDSTTPVSMAAYTGPSRIEGGAVVESGSARISVWGFPDDPALPGLPHSFRQPLVGQLLGEVGVLDTVRTIRTTSYRPRRRAVVEVQTAGHRLFIKVVKPNQVQALQDAHKVVAEHTRVPHSLGFSPELGIAVLEPIAGTTLRNAIEIGETHLPGPEHMRALLDTLPRMPTPRPGLVDRFRAHSRFLEAVIPDEAARLERLGVAMEPEAAESLVPAHNDFHSSQLMVADGAITGLIDIDTVGLGFRADDYAMLLAHLHSLALTSRNGSRFAEYGKTLLPEFEREVGRDRLRQRVAAAMVGFATGPFRSQRPDWPTATSSRLAAAEDWLIL